MKRVGLGVLGAAGGLAAWVAMIAVTTGVCAVPVLDTLWCSPFPGGGVPKGITLWDLVLLVVFVCGGASLGWKKAEGSFR